MAREMESTFLQNIHLVTTGYYTEICTLKVIDIGYVQTLGTIRHWVYSDIGYNFWIFYNYFEVLDCPVWFFLYIKLLWLVPNTKNLGKLRQKKRDIFLAKRGRKQAGEKHIAVG